jgi:hypothetical protein
MLKRSGGETETAPPPDFAEVASSVPQAGDAPEVNEVVGSASASPDGSSTGSPTETPSDVGVVPHPPAEDTGKKGRKKGEKDERSDGGPPSANGSAGSGDASSMELDADAVVDPVLLAKEFSGLLQVESGDDEGSS